jgi:hypothetical protein
MATIGTKPLALSLLLAAFFFPAKHASAFQPLHAGGSNLAWYDISESARPAPDTGRNCREPFGILANYDEKDVRKNVRTQLRSMYQQGQRRLRIPVFHMRDSSSGKTILNSRGGSVSNSDGRKIRQLLKDIKAAGFEWIEVGFFPAGQNVPFKWQHWQEDLFEENWQFLTSVRQLVVDSDIPYQLDLLNEGAPAINQPMMKQYVFRLWDRYVRHFGRDDTIGFSIGAASIDRYTNMVAQMRKTGRGLPHHWSIHIYDHLFRGDLQKLDNHMHSVGDHRAWDIGETYYNDARVDAAFDAMELKRDVLHILQWPVTSQRGCDGHVDTVPTIAYPYTPDRDLDVSQTD